MGVFVHFLDSSHPSGDEVLPQVALMCACLMTSDVEHLFVCLLAFVYLLGRNVFLDPLTIFKIELLACLLLSCKSSLCNMGTRPLSDR